MPLVKIGGTLFVEHYFQITALHIQTQQVELASPAVHTLQIYVPAILSGIQWLHQLVFPAFYRQWLNGARICINQ